MVLLGVALLILPGRAAAQDLPLGNTTGGGGALPQTGAGVAPGADVRVGDLRRQLERAFSENTPPAPNPNAPAITFLPAIDAQEEWTDNVLRGDGRRTSDFITVLTPSLGIQADTSRVQATLAYAPSFQFYAQQGRQNRVDQNLNGTTHITLLPDTFFLDLQAFAANSSATAGSEPNGLVARNRQNDTQTYSFSASPYLQHRFNGTGTAEIGYTISRTLQNNVSNQGVAQLTPQQIALENFLLANGVTSLNGQPLPTNPAQDQNVTTQTEHLGFTSGEDFGRTSGTAVATGSQYQGSGVLSGAYRYTAIIDVGYAITRTITALGRVGYEDIKYSGSPAIHISDPVWGVGTHLTPNADSSITLRYGHEDGFNSAYVDGFYAPTARTRVSVNYTDALTTGLQDIQSALSQSTLDPYGNLVDRQTGTPIVPVSSFFGSASSNNLVREKRLSLTASLLLDRDVFSLTVEQQTQKVIAVAVNQPATGASSGIDGTITWSHDINDDLGTSLFVSYGKNKVANALLTVASNTGSRDTFGLGASAHYRLSETLSGNVLYSYTSQGTGVQGLDAPTNLVAVGLHKSF